WTTRSSWDGERRGIGRARGAIWSVPDGRSREPPSRHRQPGGPHGREPGSAPRRRPPGAVRPRADG
ncbi:MAG: hypothetical protein AVDCRST_MAG49-4242, partial [uncultured Thermomicrobiales bacterium]